MTCVVGMVDKGKVYIAADTAVSTGWMHNESVTGKIFKRGDFLFGCAGNARAIQAVRYDFSCETPAEEVTDLEEYMCTHFVSVLRECFKKAGVGEKLNEVEKGAGAMLMVGIRGKLFTITENFYVRQLADPFAAIGIGQEIALGALYALSDRKMPVLGKLKVALEASSHYMWGIAPPFEYITEEGIHGRFE